MPIELIDKFLFEQKKNSLNKVFSKKGLFIYNLEKWSVELEAIKRIIQVARKYNIELTLFINPYHYTYLDIIRENGYWSSFENFKQVLVNTVNIHGKGDVALWDFAQYSDYTVSAVPLKKDINSAFNWFWEPAHYKVELGELILAEMFGQNCTKNNAQPVGMKLNNINMKDYLLNENKRRKNLLNRKIIEK